MPDHVANHVDVEKPQNSPNRRSPSKFRWWLWILVAMVLAVGAYIFSRSQTKARAAKSQQQTSSNTAVPISTVTARKGDIGVYVNALGTVTPIRTVSVTSRVVGAIESVNYKEGQVLHERDALLEIDPRPYQAQLTQFEGQLARDQALLNEARIDHDRYQQAFARNAIPKQQLDDQAQLVAQNEGTVKSDQGLVDNARLNVAYCHITSPIDGRVGLRLVDPGNIVQANGTNPLLVITQLDPITVVFSVAEDFLSQIQQQLRQGKRLQVQALDRAEQTVLATGSLLTLDNEIDTSTGTVKLKAIFPNKKDDSLFPNQFVNAKLLVDTLRGVILVPSPAIQRGGQGAFVYKVQPDQTVAMQSVTVGTTDGNIAAVQGLNEGAVIAADNFDKLQAGAKVAPRQAQETNGPNQRAPKQNAAGQSDSGPRSGQ